MSTPELDDDIIDAMQPVNWQAISEDKAASFGISVSLLREELRQQAIASASMWTRMGSVVSMAVITLVCSLLGASPVAIIAGLILSQAASTGVLAWRLKQNAKDATEAKQHVLDELKALAAAHPR